MKPRKGHAKGKAPKNSAHVNSPVTPELAEDGEDVDVVMEDHVDEGDGASGLSGGPSSASAVPGETADDLRQRQKIRLAYRDIEANLHGTSVN